MANSDILFEFILSHEGNYSNHPNDLGGPTNKGVTLATMKSVGKDLNNDGKIDVEDLKLLSDKDVEKIFKKYYWDKCLGDQIKSQSVANMIIDWYYNSGKWAITNIQSLLQLPEDGIVGPITLGKINSLEPRELFQAIRKTRINYYERIVRKRPANKVFLNGWVRRTSSIEFGKLRCNNNKLIGFTEDGSRI